MAIGLAVVIEFQLRNGQRESGGPLGPSLVEFNQAIENVLVIRGIILGRYDKVPRLSVVGGSRPPCRLEKGAQFFGFHWTIRKGARTPALTDQIMNRNTRFGSFLQCAHNFSFYMICYELLWSGKNSRYFGIP